MMGKARLIRRNWSPARHQLEQLIADRHWHGVLSLTISIAVYHDPRIAARTWLRNHHESERSLVSVQERFERDEAGAILWGQRFLAEQTVKGLVHQGRLELRGYTRGSRDAFRDAEVRLSPQEQAFGRERPFCYNGHPRPASGWPAGKATRCLLCQRARYARMKARRDAAKAAAA